jgi:hypothetical protein
MVSTNIPTEQSLAQENEWQRDLREQYFAHCLPSAARIQFLTAVNSIEYRSLTEPQYTRDEFEGCLKAIDQIHLIGRLLREEGHQVMLDDDKLSSEGLAQTLRQQLFNGLNQQTQQIIRSQGLQL